MSRLMLFCALFLGLVFSSCNDGNDNHKTIAYPHEPMVNQVVLSGNAYANLAAGFLVKSNEDYFAVSSKQLFQAFAAEGLKTVDFEGKLESWMLTSFTEGVLPIRLGYLINKNASEQASLPNLVNDRDFLVFALSDSIVHEGAFELEVGPLGVGDQLFTSAWIHGKKKAKKAEYNLKVFRLYGNQVFLESSSEIENPRDLVGSPVYTKEGRLIGIVSTIENGAVRACSINYLFSVIREFQQLKKNDN